MDEFLKWLANNPSIATTLILAIVILISATVLMYLVAFLRGQEISFWPPKIGAKPYKQNRDENVQKPEELTGEDTQTALPEPAKRHWEHSHPKEYTGKVWIRVKREQGSQSSNYKYTVNWGPWRYRGTLNFGSRLSVTLWHRKDGVGSIPIYFDISSKCRVEFGTGEPQDKSALDINEGWQKH